MKKKQNIETFMKLKIDGFSIHSMVSASKKENGKWKKSKLFEDTIKLLRKEWKQWNISATIIEKLIIEISECMDMLQWISSKHGTCLEDCSCVLQELVKYHQNFIYRKHPQLLLLLMQIVAG